MGNFSKDPSTVLQDALEKGYTRVRFQQGKPLIDRELNLLGDLVSPQRLAAHHLGNGVPADSNGFRISSLNPSTDDFEIEAGRCLVNGYEVVLAANTSYQTQPNLDNVTSLPSGTSFVYLHIFRREVTGAEDSSLLNADDVGFETAVREKVDWEVLVSSTAINDLDHFLLAEIDTRSVTVQDRRRTNLTLAVLADEINLARGSASELSNRLNASLADDGTLKANVVESDTIAEADGTTGQDTNIGDGLKTGHIQDGAVTGAKIADSTITADRLDASFREQLFTERIIGSFAFSPFDANGALRTIVTNFRPRLLVISGGAYARYDPGSLNYSGGFVGGGVILDENGTITDQRVTGPFIWKFTTGNYQITRNVAAVGYASFRNYVVTPRQDVLLRVFIDEVTDELIRFRLSRFTSSAFNPISVFNIHLTVLILG